MCRNLTASAHLLCSPWSSGADVSSVHPGQSPQYLGKGPAWPPCTFWPLCLFFGVWTLNIPRVGAAGAVGFALTVSVGRLHPLLFAIFLPNSIAKLFHAVEVRVVQERQEIAIPQPVLGRVTDPDPDPASCAGKKSG
ncbi:hypothetical protein EYF80_033405 [Liparis tanakae]|uniref:Uncharacterized protein n=1 Tax=Liparis tanakae TaxID=230148 RepID=A0A4Z2GSK5_9TELE|nr:hypothetical protein EYF80_033405 [Liparis tanakae]